MHVPLPIAMKSLSLALVLLASVAAPSLAQTLDPAELLLRLDRLEGENRRLNGQVEQLQFQIRRLEDQVRRFQSDVDFRFKESGGKGLPQAAAPPAPA
ncbi:MAG TPA: YbgF trimerization domain-containing protein, partial [Beijerinckiaceae bacterium]|nr:YbgF trimerization domain-containing protein [Beijerinckiaceae bacterium]